jgi:hypothetical protein
MNQDSSSRSGFGSIVVRLAGLWILAGAVAKLLLGTPKDLPAIVREHSPFGLDLTFHLVIGIELAIVALAWIVPFLSWPLIVALFGFFDFILVSQLRAGAESCGCFGASIKVDPRIMLAVDSALLLALFVSRPWTSTSRSIVRRIAPLAACIAIAFALPWIVIRNPGAVANADPASGASAGAPRYVVMEPEKWVNKSVFDIQDLTRWIEADKLPTDGKIVLWRQGCTHCAAHLRLMAGEKDESVPILLVQIRDDLKDGRAVDLMPDGPNVSHVELPENQQVVLQTPWELRVEGGVVTAALDEEHAKATYAPHEKGG